MSRDEKLRAAMRRNPAGWSMAEIERLCRSAGFAISPPRGGGSHYKISHLALPQILTVPFKRPIKPVYVRQLLKMIDDAGKL